MSANTNNKERILEMDAEVCKALGHPLRMEVIGILDGQELCFSDILEHTGGLKSNLSRHLSVMTQAGILHSRKGGKCVYFSVSSQKVVQVCHLFREIWMDSIKEQQQWINELSEKS